MTKRCCLFHAAAEGDARLLGRLATQLVKPGIVDPFVVAVSQASDVLRRTPVPRRSHR